MTKKWFYIGWKVFNGVTICWEKEIEFKTDDELCSLLDSSAKYTSFLNKGRAERTNVFLKELASNGNDKDRSDLLKKILHT